jgi:threonine dehydrogenase-like Zn-dependent dehydrogenase
VKAALLTRPGELQIVERPAPTDRAKALVSLETVGVCGTDISIFRGKIPVTYPRVLGHELVGRVRRAGPRGLVSEGTRVLVNPSVACGSCHACRMDCEHLCPNGALIGRDSDGGFAELIAVDETLLLPVPERMPDADTALLQVMGTCVHAQRSFTTFPGQTAVVVGLGVVGFLMVQLLRARGITQILGVTRSVDKQRLGRQFGATQVVVPEKAAAACADLTHGRGADVVIEAVGTPATFSQAIDLAGLAATVVLFGTIGGTASVGAGLPFYDLYYKELTLRNPRAARHRDYERAIEMASSGQVELAPLWSAGFPLEAATDAIAAAQDRTTLKVTLDLRTSGAGYSQ